MKRLVASLAFLVFLIGAPSAFAEATRTWVSGVGDDANPCSRTAPCKTWAGAISKTAAGGEIDALDPGGFGGVTITKSITLSGRGTNASILAAGGTNGININGAGTGVAIVVNIQHLSINGVGTGLTGIKVFDAKVVRLEDVQIFGFTSRGIDWNNTASGKLFVNNTQIHDAGARLISFQPAAGGGRATITNTVLENSTAGAGLTASGAVGPTSVFVYNVTSSGNQNGFVADSGAKLTLTSSLIVDDSLFGIFSDSAAIVRVSDCTIQGNGTGLSETNGGQILTRLNNTLVDNTTNGAFTGPYGAS